MLIEELKKRNLPPLKSREEMIEILQREEYGYLPNVPYEMSVSDPTVVDRRYASGGVFENNKSGSVTSSFVDMTITTKHGSHKFPIYRLIHNDMQKRPMVLFINFHPGNASHYFPIEELSEHEVDYLVFNYKDISSDDGDFSTGIAPLLLPNSQDSDTTCGKIMVWAWASMRVLDYALTLPGTDTENVAIVGHSRLGKTALVTAMMDDRFKYACSNNSGCAGAAIAHGGTGLTAVGGPGDLGRGENINDIVTNFPFWFCKNYIKYKDKMYADDFDQHYLLASIAPRCVVVASNSRDDWADQKSEQLCCLAASSQWEKLGYKGIVDCDHFLSPGEAILDGRVGYFMIDFMHFISRHSWHRFLEFIEKHKND